MATVDSAVHDAAEPAGYPREWEFDGLLSNGEAVVVRPIRPADAPALVGLHGAVSPGTLHRHVLLTGPAPVGSALAWCAGLGTVSIALSAILFRRRTAA